MSVHLILVTGDRDWDEPYVVCRALLPSAKRGYTLVHGDARGLDRQAAEVAASLGMEVIAVPARWSEFGRGAGPRRNREMLDMGPVGVLAFHDRLWEGSRGTRDCVEAALRRGLIVKHFTSNGVCRVLRE